MAIVLSLTDKQLKALTHLLNYQAGSDELVQIQAKLTKAAAPAVEKIKLPEPEWTDTEVEHNN